MTILSTLDVVTQANSYVDVFSNPNTIKMEYHRMARELHPDGFTGMRKDAASEAFHKLSVFKAEAMRMRAEGRFGQRTILATIKTKRATHEITRQLATDTLAVYYLASTRTGSDTDASVVKIAKSPKDNDLLAQEARALKKLHAEDVDPEGNPRDASKWTRAYPELVDTFLHSEGRRRAVVTRMFDGFLPLQTVGERFPNGLDPIHGAWMFRRLLMALGYAHDKGVVHGAVTPDNILIGPEDHAVILTNWCYSVVIDSESETNFIKAVVPMYKQLYPEEVLAKDPASAATDIYMAAAVMNHLMPVAPKRFRAFFKGTMLTKQAARPQNAWGLLKEFDELLQEIGQPFYPRRFVEFVVPSGAA